MNVVILGSKGMLGSDLMAACAAAGLEAQGLDLPGFDITDDPRVREMLPRADAVVNCAAYTKVDDAESHRAEAFAVNADGARRVARECARLGARLVHLSTDYVFDGRAKQPYREEDPSAPLNVYGASKLAGETAVREEGGHALVVRTQSLFGRQGPNFVRAIVRQLKQGDAPLRVVADQVSAPTYTRHFADALVRLLMLGKEGVVHVTASGRCSWFEFAGAIAARVKPGAVIQPITAEELARPAARPANSVLDNGRYVSWTGRPMPSWERGLDEYLAEEKFI